MAQRRSRWLDCAIHQKVEKGISTYYTCCDLNLSYGPSRLSCSRRAPRFDVSSAMCGALSLSRSTRLKHWSHIPALERHSPLRYQALSCKSRLAAFRYRQGTCLETVLQLLSLYDLAQEALALLIRLSHWECLNEPTRGLFRLFRANVSDICRMYLLPRRRVSNSNPEDRLTVSWAAGVVRLL